MARNNKQKESENEKLTCVNCRRTLSKDSFFAHRNKFMSSELSICKECAMKFVDENDLSSVISILRFLDIPLYIKRWEGVIEKGEDAILGRYLRQIAMSKNKYFDDGDTFYINDENKDEIFTKKEVESEIIELSETELKAKNDVIKLLGYDPFDVYRVYDQKFLYPELVSYLDEDTVEDPFKISVVIQIVTNNLQIRWTDIAINQLNENTESFIKYSKDIKELMNTKMQCTQANDKLSKENQIALKHRGDAKSKNSTLGSMMKNLRELDFDKAEQDYYDMNKAYGMRQALDISHKSILEIILFDEQKQHELFKGQRELIQQLQDEKFKLKEEIRLLAIENNKLKNENKQK